MLAYVLVLAVIVARIVFRPLAFAPVGPALLFFGAYMPRRWMWVPLALLAATDVYLTRSSYGYPFTADILVTWAWYALVLWAGGALLKGRVRPLPVAGVTVAAAVAFFAISNFAVWAVWNMYPKTLGGLAACYVAALPFFRNQFVSDLLFAAVMFAVPLALPALRPAEAKERAA
ncbi:MAG TPA: DUF6580 family putative transport protein [Terriglobales bacterium]|nr:DUF6580 family putative transport protein [Terriglobales bacterium]